VIAEPFPHLVVKNVLEDRLYRQLMEEYKSNSRLNCSASRVL